MGCMAQSRGQELIDRLPDVDLVLGTQKFHRAADYLDEILAGRRGQDRGRGGRAGQRGDHPRAFVIRQWRDDGGGHNRAPSPRLSASCRAATNIAHFASCLTRAARNAAGRIPDIVAECRQLVAQGVKEITLLGQIVTSYGKRRVPSPPARRAIGTRSAFRPIARSRSRNRRAGTHPVHFAASEGLRRRFGRGLRAAAQAGARARTCPSRAAATGC